MRWPNRVSHFRVVVERRKLLIEIAECHALGEFDLSLVRLHQSQKTTQECRLPATVRPQERPAFAARNVDRNVAEQRPIKTLGDAFRPNDEIAASLRLGESDRGGGDFTRRRNRFDPFELFATVFRLRVFLTIRVAGG